MTDTLSSGSHDPASLRAWIKRRLLTWFDRHQRDVPWRRDRDPYRIWISEVMLQQTQVATVIPFYEKFMRAFPTLRALADADEQSVLRQWAGLGYYRRARNLRDAAKALSALGHETIPDDPEILHGLPGMGRYTVNAVLSQSYDRRLPILEANSRRVLCRLFGRTEDPLRRPLSGWLWHAAESLLPLRKRCGDVNQALMELGALLCTPKAPKCNECPLRSKCAARKLGMEERLPRRAQPPEKVAVAEAAVVVRRGDTFLLVQRPASAARWPSFWEFPHVELEENEDHVRAARRLLGRLGFKASLGAEITSVRHGVTRFAITMVCFEAEYKSGKLRSADHSDHRWLQADELATLPVSSPQRRLIETLRDPDRQRMLF